jgi:hypothetical protein
MTDNLYNFKKRMRPEDYDNGPVKIFNAEEIDEWCRTCYDKVLPSIQAQQGLSEQDIKFLDSMKVMQSELQFDELLEGTRESGGKEDGES